MPPKPTKRPPQGLTLSKPNAIYELALNRPLEGFELSPLFRPALGPCPHCCGKLWTRIRFGTIAILGIICEDCDWRQTFAQTVDTPSAPPQMYLFDVQKNSAAECLDPLRTDD